MDNGQSPLIELTQSQLLFWAGQKLDESAPLYNMPLIFEIQGVIDPVLFQKAFQILVNKSDTLRIIFETKNDIPFQRILETYEAQVEWIEWSAEPNKEQMLDEWLNGRIGYQFDPAHPLFDVALIKCSDSRFIWYFNQHHLITDAWAVSVLYKNMVSIYTALQKGEMVSNDPFPSFRDFIDFEKKNRIELKESSVKEYWQKQLKQLPDPPRLYGREAGKNTESKAKRVEIELGAERSEKLRGIAMEKGIRGWTTHLSLFNIFSTLLFAYLYRISGQEKISIGTPAHNRPSKTFKDTAGVFIEVFPVTADISNEDNFLSLFKKVQYSVNGFLKNAQPGASKPSLNRAFNVVLNYINAAFTDFNGIPVQSEWIHSGHIDPHHHLRLQVHDWDASGTIQLHFDLNEGVFGEADFKRVPYHFLQLIDAFIEKREASIMEVPLTSNKEMEQVQDLNQRALKTDSIEPVLTQFLQIATESPDLEAFSFGDKTFSYGHLHKVSNQLAHHLRKNGVPAGGRVALYLNRSPEFLITVMAVLNAGAAFVPIATNYPAQRVRYMLEDVKADILISTEPLIESLGKLEITILNLDEKKEDIAKESTQALDQSNDENDLAYVMYTSGSTGQPKGVMISHGALANYVHYAKNTYVKVKSPVFPLFTMVGFDLTITSIFVPLATGGSIRIYPESSTPTDLTVLDVFNENKADIVKLTPAHLELIKGNDHSRSRVKCLIVGGEAFQPLLAEAIQDTFPDEVSIYNEYGPTEATVGCVVHQLKKPFKNVLTVPIGLPISNMQCYVLDEQLSVVPQGVVGELYISGKGLASGYWERPELTDQRFVDNPFVQGTKMYQTGDYVRINESGILEYFGRKDHQVKVGGIRIELGEIEAALASFNGVESCTILTHETGVKDADHPDQYCTQCGLPSNYPDSEFDEKGVCNLCNSFESYQQKAGEYFKEVDDLHREFEIVKSNEEKTYDCMMLLSGGKDSSYALGQLVDMGLKVLAFTLDNGYISEQAKDNIRRVTNDLGVDHVFGETPAMNEVFVDSLKRYSNVCNGCFKVLYTLSTKIALEKNIPYIVTGLSRGQFFETRLTEELFWKEDVDVARIDEIILDARKSYHRVEDAVSQLMDVSMFEDDQVFEKVKFLDFYRYCDVSMDEMFEYLDKNLPWIRPTDTGRSTNCLINQVGIYVHKKEQGYSNYAFPYSWDVRLGHKEREAALDEINEEIDVAEVKKIMKEIGYSHDELEQNTRKQNQIIAFYTGEKTAGAELREHMTGLLPVYMIPNRFIHIDTIPLTPNGKIDRKQLMNTLEIQKLEVDVPFIAPGNQIEEMLSEMWSEVLGLERIGVNYNFLELGGNSLSAIRLVARINESFELDLPVHSIFDRPTVADLAILIEETILLLMQE